MGDWHHYRVEMTGPVDDGADVGMRGRQPDAVLFDFFGTLVEYEPRWTRLAYPTSHQLFVGWGHALTHDAFVAHWDAALTGLELATAESCQEFSVLDAARAFCQISGIQLSPHQCAQLADTFVAEWQQHVCPVPGIVEMIERLSAHTRLSIVSNTLDTQMVPSLLRAMGIADRFETAVLSIAHGYRKPHPSIYQVVLDRMGLDATRVVFVGDSFDADYLGPRRAGIAALLIDPQARHDIPSAERLSTVLDVEDRLRDLPQLA